MRNHIQLIIPTKTPLFDDTWLAWNEDRWGLKAERVIYSPEGKDLPRLEGVLYLDRNGRVRMPPRNPYLPFRFIPTETERSDKLYKQWVDVASKLASDIMARGVRGIIALSPGLLDARPFQWAGFDVGLRYTSIMSLPVQDGNLSNAVRNKIRKARSLGYRVELSENWEAVSACLDATGDAKGFTYKTNANDLKNLHKIMGGDAFRAYIGYNKSNDPVCAQVQLFMKGGVVLDWSKGTLRNELSSGINQLTYFEGCEDLHRCGADMLDFCGANIPPVASAKAEWGGALVPYLTLRQPTASSEIFGHIKNVLRHFKRG